MGKRNPWVVENIEAFCFYCCPECDFKSKDGDNFKRHALESHHKAKSFFIRSKNKKTEKTNSIKCIQVKTDSEHQNKINEGLEDFIPSDIKVHEESISAYEGEEFVRLSEQKAKNLNILFPDFITNKELDSFDDDETVNTFEDKLKTFDNQKLEDNVEELDIFDEENYEDITDDEISDDEISDDETFDPISKELETFDEHDVEQSQTFNKDNFEKLEKGYKCEMCSSKFAKKNILTNHMINVHMKIKDFKCKDCSKRFPTRHRMESHHKWVHLLIKPPQSYPYTCHGCKTSFKKRQQMEWHINKVHLNYKPYKCNLCEKSFLRIAELNRHMKRAHKGKTK